MTAELPQNVKDVLTTLNYTYGRGDIVGYECVRTHGEITQGLVVCKLQYGECKYPFRVESGTVYFRRHQRKVV